MMCIFSQVFFGHIMRETGRQGYKLKLIEKLEARFPGIMVLTQDPITHPGVPDLVLLYFDRWAALEVKASKNSSVQPRPRQPFYVEKMNQMSYAAFIYPENEEDVLNELQRAFNY